MSSDSENRRKKLKKFTLADTSQIDIVKEDIIELCSDDSYLIIDFVNQLEQGIVNPCLRSHPMLFDGMNLNIEKGKSVGK